LSLKVQLLTVNAWEPKLMLTIAPPTPRPRMNEPLPAVLLLPPSAALWSNVLFVIVVGPLARIAHRVFEKGASRAI
jgi:hypothetical protein